MSGCVHINKIDVYLNTILTIATCVSIEYAFLYLNQDYFNLYNSS